VLNKDFERLGTMASLRKPLADIISIAIQQ
jgi:hypothetical protein